MVFGIVGCATSSTNSLSGKKTYEELGFHKAEVINIVTGEKFFVGDVLIWHPADKINKSRSIAKVRAVELCDDSFNTKALLKKYLPYPAAPSEYDAARFSEFKNSKCVISRIDREVFFRDKEDLMSKFYKEYELAFGKVQIWDDQNNLIAPFSSNIIRTAANCTRLDAYGYVSDCSEFKAKFGLLNRVLEKDDFKRLRTEASRYNFKFVQDQRAEQNQKQFEEFVKRCKGFGFTGESNIAACVQREVQHDLELAKQEQRLQQLENRIASAKKPSNDKPFLLEVLSILADEAERQDDLEQRIRLYELESEVSTLRSSKNVKQATCSLNRNC
jgi:hypothetical protein